MPASENLHNNGPDGYETSRPTSNNGSHQTGPAGPVRATSGLMRCSIASLFDDLISAGEQRVRHVYPQRLGRLEVDDQFKFRRLIKRNVLWLFAVENVSAFTVHPAQPFGLSSYPSNAAIEIRP
jgi:hypothetical protein